MVLSVKRSHHYLLTYMYDNHHRETNVAVVAKPVHSRRWTKGVSYDRWSLNNGVFLTQVSLNIHGLQDKLDCRKSIISKVDPGRLG